MSDATELSEPVGDLIRGLITSVVIPAVGAVLDRGPKPDEEDSKVELTLGDIAAGTLKVALRFGLGIAIPTFNEEHRKITLRLDLLKDALAALRHNLDSHLHRMDERLDESLRGLESVLWRLEWQGQVLEDIHGLVLEPYRTQANALFRRAERSYRRGMVTKALSDLKQAASLDYENVPVHATLGAFARYEEKDLRRAHDYFCHAADAAAAVHGNARRASELALRAADVAWEMGDMAVVRDDIENALKYDPDSLDARFWKLRCLARMSPDLVSGSMLLDLLDRNPAYAERMREDPHIAAVPAAEGLFRRLWSAAAIGPRTAAYLTRAAMLPCESGLAELAFSPDGTMLATRSTGVAQVWHVREGRLLHTFRLAPADDATDAQRDYFRAIAFSSAFFAVATRLGELRFWSPAQDAEVHPVEKPALRTGEELSRIAFSVDGSRLLSSWYTSFGYPMLRVWNMERGGSPDSIPLVADIRYGTPEPFSPLGRLVAQEAPFGVDGTARRSWTDDAIVESGGALILSEVDTGRVRLVLHAPESLGFNPIIWSPDGRFVATRVPWSGKLFIWRVFDGALVKTMESGPDYAFSADGALLALTDDAGAINLRSLEDGALLCSLEPHGEGVSSIAFSADGHWLASGSGNGTVQLWHVSQHSRLLGPG